MSLRFNTLRAPRSDQDWREFLHAVERADAEDESEWIEWKSSLDLSARATRATLARHIIGMANRRVKEAARSVEGFGYVLIGIEPGNRCGVTRVDFADLQAGIASYLGPHGPRWTARYDTENGTSVLSIIVDPPRDGDRIYHLNREFGNYRAGDIFVRKLGKTDKADPGDIDYLTRRAESSTITRRWIIAGAAAVVGVSLAGWELTRTGGEGTVGSPRGPAVNRPDGTKIWSSAVEGVALTPPVVASRRIFVSTFYDGKYGFLYALNGSDGSQAWSMQGHGNGEFSSPVVADGIVYVGTGTGGLYAVSADRGSRLWYYTAGGMNIIPVLGQGMVYVVGTELAALRLGDGKRAWGFPAGTPAVVADIVYAPGEDGRVYALRADEGTQIWKSVELAATKIQLVAGGTLYVSSSQSTHALRASDGKLLWSISTGVNEITSIAVDAGTVFVGTAVSYEGSITTTTPDGYLYALRANDGELLWHFPARGGVYSIVSSNHAAYLRTADGRACALRASDGSIIWNFALGGGDWPTGPIEVGGIILISAGTTSTTDGRGVSASTPGGHVYALHASSGKERWTFRTGSTPGQPVAADSIVYVWSYDGNVYAIRA